MQVALQVDFLLPRLLLYRFPGPEIRGSSLTKDGGGRGLEYVGTKNMDLMRLSPVETFTSIISMQTDQARFVNFKLGYQLSI